ncbi:hypothetical protein DP16_1811 [Stenotrophomonas maltophilia]|nr:hypothetical protein DP16_1811 [Stenotrophomonas maltophilia]SNW09179.1 Uncharacterised protein [Stenotrophomonas maltophilia]
MQIRFARVATHACQHDVGDEVAPPMMQRYVVILVATGRLTKAIYSTTRSLEGSVAVVAATLLEHQQCPNLLSAVRAWRRLRLQGPAKRRSSARLAGADFPMRMKGIPGQEHFQIGGLEETAITCSARLVNAPILQRPIAARASPVFGKKLHQLVADSKTCVEVHALKPATDHAVGKDLISQAFIGITPDHTPPCLCQTSENGARFPYRLPAEVARGWSRPSRSNRRTNSLT